MKIRKKYHIRISGIQRVVFISRVFKYKGDYFSKYYTCNFEQAKYHLRQASENKYYISKVRQ